MPDTSADSGSTKHNYWNVKVSWSVDSVEDTDLYHSENWVCNEGWTVVEE